MHVFFAILGCGDYQPEPDFSLDSDQKRKVYPCLNCSTDVLIYHGRGTQCPKEGL